MLWKGHFILGFFLFLIIGYFVFDFSDLRVLILSIIAGFSALIPDLDHDLSKSRKWLNKLFPFVSFIVLFIYLENWYSAILITIFLSGIYFLLFTFLKPKHRGITHTLFALIVFSIIIYSFDELLSYAFFVGYLSHLLGDKTIKLF